ncbi:MAG: lipid-binding protein [Azospira oryzae]|jgi:polyisoprenoid-binding protein YceI|nr:MAG: lipid-binding protein [Azospira oryzae]
MKYLNTVVLIAVITTLSSFMVKDAEFKVDTQKSKITWVGKKVTGQHNGTINLAEGSFTSKGKTISGGTFTIDMTTIKDADGSARLEGHLKADDFFATDKFPKSTFVITKIDSKGTDQYAVKGNLTIKGITNEVEFPATIKMAKDQLTASAKIVVDRTKFDIKFRSGNFFENLGDKAIEDNFELNVELVASSK